MAASLTEFHEDVLCCVHGDLIKVLAHQHLHILSIPVLRNILCVQMDLGTNHTHHSKTTPIRATPMLDTPWMCKDKT